VKHLLRYAVARRLEPDLFIYCGNPDCDIVYLRVDEAGSVESPAEVFRRNDIKERARPFASGSERWSATASATWSGRSRMTRVVAPTSSRRRLPPRCGLGIAPVR
jgi:hypothetical protein